MGSWELQFIKDSIYFIPIKKHQSWERCRVLILSQTLRNYQTLHLELRQPDIYNPHLGEERSRLKTLGQQRCQLCCLDEVDWKRLAVWDQNWIVPDKIIHVLITRNTSKYYQIEQSDNLFHVEKILNSVQEFLYKLHVHIPLQCMNMFCVHTTCSQNRFESKQHYKDLFTFKDLKKKNTSNQNEFFLNFGILYSLMK